MVVAPASFRALGLTWSGIAPAAMEVRTARAGQPFGPWQPLEPNEPGAGRPESARRAPNASEPLWVGRAARVQVRTRGASDVRVVVIDPGSSPPALPRHAARADAGGVAQPTIVSRAQWGADESLRGEPRYAPVLRYAVVHHTAGSNDYSQADAPAVVRSVYLYHTRTLGWSDIGYAFLVDRFGTIYEGRAGGMTRPVVGAHVYGFNTGSTSVSLMGNFDKVAPTPELLDATARLLAWRLDVAHLDPSARVRTVSGGGDRYAAGVTVEQPMIAAHRDYGSTACPGALVYAELGALRAAVVAVPGLRIWDPRPQPLDPAFTDGPIRVSARLLRRCHAGASRSSTPPAPCVASGAGAGALVDYTWPGPGIGGAVGDLTYKIEASDASGAARPATGRLDGRDLQTPDDIPNVPLADLAAKPRILTPNGDGAGDTPDASPGARASRARVSVWVDDAARHAALPALRARPPARLAAGRLDRPGRQRAPAAQRPLRAAAGAGAGGRDADRADDGRRPAARRRQPRSPRATSRRTATAGCETAQITVDRLEAGPLRVRVRAGLRDRRHAARRAVDRRAGSASTWDPSGVPDGLYRLIVDAPSPGGTLVLGAKVTVDRTAPRAQIVSVRRRGPRRARRPALLRDRRLAPAEQARAAARRGARRQDHASTFRGAASGRTMTLYLRDRAGTPAKPIRIWRP